MHALRAVWYCASVCSYAVATRCPVCGTELAYAATRSARVLCLPRRYQAPMRLRACCTLPGTEIGYAATRLLRGVRY
eukprot:3940567-Rhodomonas_salina.2